MKQIKYHELFWERKHLVVNMYMGDIYIDDQLSACSRTAVHVKAISATASNLPHMYIEQSIQSLDKV